MTQPQTNKARGLEALHDAGIKVPPFVVYSRAPESDRLPEELSAGELIVRPCAVGEDGLHHSYAGQLRSVGPVTPDRVQELVEAAFAQSGIVEVIVQKYVRAPSGVLCCFADGTSYLEYAALPRAVTDGRGSPFVALIPNDIPRYRGIVRLCKTLLTRFGPCNVELSVEEEPWVFQVRPLTAAVHFDSELAEVKMLLQELPEDLFIQNEFCVDLLESPGYEKRLAELFCRVRNRLVHELSLKGRNLRLDDFLFFADQIYVSERKFDVSFAAKQQSFQLGRWVCRALQRHLTQSEHNGSSEELMERAIALRLCAEFLERLPGKPLGKRLLHARTALRREVCRSLGDSSETNERKLSRRLCEPLQKNSAAQQWLSCGWDESPATTIVPGDLDSGPYLVIRGGSIPDEVPSPAPVVVCDQLYPSLYKFFPAIRGIICEGGAITSHLAILAREAQLPLRIQDRRILQKIDRS